MPAVARQDQGRASLSDRLLLREDERLLEDPLVECLPLRVHPLEVFRQGSRFGRCITQQQPDAVHRIADAASGIEPGREDVADLTGAQVLARQPAGVEQRLDSLPARTTQHLQSVPHQGPVDPDQWHDVGHGRQGHQVQEMHRQGRRQAECGHEGAHQHEGNPGPAEIAKAGLVGLLLRIDDRDGRRQDGPGQVMIGDHHRDPRRPGRRHRLHGGDAAVTRQDQAGPDLAGPGEPRGPEVIAVAHAVRHERLHRGAGQSERAGEHGRGALAIHVVVTVHQDRVSVVHRRHHRLDRRGHPVEGERIGQRLEVRAEECLRRLHRGHSALDQQGGQDLRHAEACGECTRHPRVRGRREGPSRADGRGHPATSSSA